MCIYMKNCWSYITLYAEVNCKLRYSQLMDYLALVENPRGILQHVYKTVPFDWSPLLQRNDFFSIPLSGKHLASLSSIYHYLNDCRCCTMPGRIISAFWQKNYFGIAWNNYYCNQTHEVSWGSPIQLHVFLY